MTFNALGNFLAILGLAMLVASLALLVLGTIRATEIRELNKRLDEMRRSAVPALELAKKEDAE